MTRRMVGIRSERFQTAIKALLLLALALFLYTRLAGGTLFFYINQRFVVYTMLAIIGLILVAISYRPIARKSPRQTPTRLRPSSIFHHLGAMVRRITSTTTTTLRRWVTTTG
ncbi:MAG: hypothetical protein IPK16_02570 [Anaerolineales bacterium]|nr:hypothetical protein [Anaerolineales bacterium]